MNEEVEFYIDSAKESMDKAIAHLQDELSKLRAGKASPGMVEGIKVDYYGVPSPISQIANVSCPDARTISIAPWEKPMLSAIDKAIREANLGFNPNNDGVVVRINIPALTEERRRELAKRTKVEGENAKIAIRNIRRDANESIKKLQKDGLAEDEAKQAEALVQTATDKFTEKVDAVLVLKEKEIMTV